MRDRFSSDRLPDTTRLILIGALLAYGLALGPTVLCALTFLGAIANEAGNLKAQAFAGALWALPITLLLSLPASWVCYGRRVYRLALAVAALPLLVGLCPLVILGLPLPTGP